MNFLTILPSVLLKLKNDLALLIPVHKSKLILVQH
jgi:hypothetical protein